MEHCTKSIMNEALSRYISSNKRTLSDCYSTYSNEKFSALQYCYELMDKYDGYDMRIIGHNTSTFSVGFIGTIAGQKAFFYITKDHDRFILIN